MNTSNPTTLSHVNIWDDALSDNHSNIRKSQTLTWAFGLDREQNYKVNSVSRKFEKEKTYNPSDFSYTFNSQGIRCDELAPKDVKFLYAGCSFTEGEGLPVDHIWASFLNELIKSEYKDKFGYHNIGRGGLSTAGITRKIYHAIEGLKLRPKMLIVLFPSIFRTEFYVDNIPDPRSFAPFDYVPNYIPSNLTKEHRFYYENFEQNIRLINSLQEFYRNIILIEALCGRYGIELKFGCWQGLVLAEHLPSDDFSYLPKEYIVKDYSNGGIEMIDLQKLIADLMPKNLKDKYLDVPFRGESILTDKPFEHTIARDYAHPGPNCHWDFANAAFKKIKPELDKIYEQSNKHKGPKRK